MISEKKNEKGLFIVFEGLDGCGKTTVMGKVFDQLSEYGLDVVCVRQPGGTPAAEDIRNILKSVTYEGEEINSLSEYLLFGAAREQLDHNVIKPMLADGKIVLSDRHYLSTHAYQGMKIPAIDNLVARTPDMTVFVDASLETCMVRKSERGDVCRIEQKFESFFKGVHDRLHEYINDPGHGIIVRVNSEDFDSQEYKEGIEMAVSKALDLQKAKQMSLGLEDEFVTVKEFERQVLETESVRVIIRTDVNQQVKPYNHSRLDDDHTYGDLMARLNNLINVPFSIASVMRNPTNATLLSEVRIPKTEGVCECL